MAPSPLLSSADADPVEAAAPSKVRILPDSESVGAEIRSIVRAAASSAIASRGRFALAIPGGSILQMLVGTGLSPEDGAWTSVTTVAYVNHKCVGMEDGALATHAKASALFFKDWSEACHVIVMDGTGDGHGEAASYQAKLRALPADVLPVDGGGLPVFDLALVGVGDDGHIGSLYPDRDEVLIDGADSWVLPVAMKEPPSITLSLPVMQNAKQVVIAACGVSEKYPQGKSAGMKRAIADDTETIRTFPAVGLRGCATWVLDEAAASKLGEDYASD